VVYLTPAIQKELRIKRVKAKTSENLLQYPKIIFIFRFLSGSIMFSKNY